MTKINNAIRTIILVDITNNNALQNKEINIQDKNVFSQEDKNKLYESKKNKKKKLFRIYASDYKRTMFKEHKWVSAFYIISIIIFFVILISSTLCLLLIDDKIDKYVYTSMILFFGGGLYTLPYFAYKFCLISQTYGDFNKLLNEKILLTDIGFNYYYSDKLYNQVEDISIFKFEINYKNIDYVEYDKRVDELFVYGNIGIYEYKDNEWKLIKFADEKDNSIPTGVLIQNVYDINLIDLFKNNNVTVKEYNYLDRRKKEKLAEKVGI